jgi:hypothetical protein
MGTKPCMGVSPHIDLQLMFIICWSFNSSSLKLQVQHYFFGIRTIFPLPYNLVSLYFVYSLMDSTSACLYICYKWFAGGWRDIHSKPFCPVCGKVYGIEYGDQPRDGTADIFEEEDSLPGYDRKKTYASLYFVYSLMDSTSACLYICYKWFAGGWRDIHQCLSLFELSLK